MIAAVVLFLLMCVGLYMLYTDVDAYGWCTWCKHIQCVETPWWSCHQVQGCQFRYNETRAGQQLHTYLCPAGSDGASAPYPEQATVNHITGVGAGAEITVQGVPQCYGENEA